MNTKRKTSLPVLLALLAIIFSAHLEAKAQEDGPYAVVIFKAVGGRADNDSKQNYRVGQSQTVKIDKLPPNAAYWISVNPGFTVNISKENADTSVSAGVFNQGKYRLTTNGVLRCAITVKKILSDYKVTLFSEKGRAGMAFDYAVGNYSAKKGALFNVGGDNAVSSVYVPPNFWVRFCDGETGGKGTGKCELFNGRGGNLRNDNAASFVQIGKGVPPKFQ